MNQATAVQPLKKKRVTQDEAASVADQEKATMTVETDENGGLWESAQIKYAPDILSTMNWWRRLFFLAVYLPIARFACAHGIFAPEGVDPSTGKLLWVERQAVHSTEWKAEQDAARYPYGFVTWLPVDRPLPSYPVQTPQRFPNSPAQELYNRTRHRTIPVKESDMYELERALAASEHVVRNHTS